MSPREAWNRSWDVNVTGAHVMTTTFLPLLIKSADPRLIFVTSGASSLTDAADRNNRWNVVPPAGLPKPLSPVSYRSAKSGLNMLAVDYERSLRNDGVKVWAVAPGFLATGLGGDAERLKQMGAGDPRVGGDAILGVVEGKRDADVGKVVREYGDSNVQPW